jgi:2-dehydropantoate 2-reductase
VEEVALATAGNISSMLQDIKRGAPTEIEYINGAIIKEGNKLGIPVPWNDILYKLVQSKVDLFDMERYENG